MPNVSNIVKTIQDIMRKDAGTYGDSQRLEQLGWMFFLKIFDDREKELELPAESECRLFSISASPHILFPARSRVAEARRR